LIKEQPAPRIRYSTKKKNSSLPPAATSGENKRENRKMLEKQTVFRARGMNFDFRNSVSKKIRKGETTPRAHSLKKGVSSTTRAPPPSLA